MYNWRWITPRGKEETNPLLHSLQPPLILVRQLQELQLIHLLTQRNSFSLVADIRVVSQEHEFAPL